MILLLFFLAFLTPHWQELPGEGGPVGIGGNVWLLFPLNNFLPPKRYLILVLGLYRNYFHKKETLSSVFLFKPTSVFE